MRVAGAALVLAVAVGCAPPPGESAAGAAPLPRPAPVSSAGGGAEAPAGTLRTEQVTVELREGPVVVRFTPLDEEVVGLTSPDAARSLRRVREAQREALAGPGGAEHALFLVSFQSAEAERSFDPGAVSVEVGGRRMRPARILPITPGWGEQRLRPATPEVAVYAFDAEVPPLRPITFRYGAVASDRWASVIPLLEAERRRAGG